uniref:Uncharacterized protein n=1 Tax=Rhizophora mucronata TaxID=61149 RepID=A0A2P2PUQ6_RHIMU
MDYICVKFLVNLGYPTTWVLTNLSDC